MNWSARECQPFHAGSHQRTTNPKELRFQVPRTLLLKTADSEVAPTALGVSTVVAACPVWCWELQQPPSSHPSQTVWIYCSCIINLFCVYWNNISWQDHFKTVILCTIVLLKMNWSWQWSAKMIYITLQIYRDKRLKFYVHVKIYLLPRLCYVLKLFSLNK